MEGKDLEILEVIKEHLAGRGMDTSKVTPDATLEGDLDLDSLDTVELTLAIEERYGIEIPDEDLEGLVTVRDAVELIRNRIGAGV
jgi:acyl carrier protein